VSRKRANWFFLLCVCQLWTDFNKNWWARPGIHINKTMHKVPISPEIYASTTLGNLKWQIEPSTQHLGYIYIHFNESLNSCKQLVSVKIVKHVVNHVIFTSCARNILLQRERKRVDAVAISPTARSVTAWYTSAHSFLMRRFSSSTSKILVRAGGGHFEYIM